MLYRDLDLDIAPDGDSFAVRARAESGEAREALSPDPTKCVSDEYEDRSADDGRLQTPIRDEAERSLGDGLFRSLFRGDVRALYDRCRGEAEDDSGVRIRLRLSPREPRLASLARVPWELLYDRREEKFLSLDPRTPVVRTFDVHHRPPHSPLTAPLGILLTTADVSGHPRLDLEREEERIAKAIAGRPDVRLETHRTNSLTGLAHELQNRRYDIVHLMMHGDYDRQEDQGILLFETPEGAKDPISGSDLARHFYVAQRPRLVVLNACLSNAASSHNPLASVAAALVLSGCPAVIGMTSSIKDAAAIELSSRLYERLASEECLEVALVKSRLAVAAATPRTTMYPYWTLDGYRFAAWSAPAIFLSPQASTDILPRIRGQRRQPSAKAGTRPTASFKTRARKIDKVTEISAHSVTINEG